MDQLTQAYFDRKVRWRFPKSRELLQLVLEMIEALPEPAYAIEVEEVVNAIYKAYVKTPVVGGHVVRQLRAGLDKDGKDFARVQLGELNLDCLDIADELEGRLKAVRNSSEDHARSLALIFCAFCAAVEDELFRRRMVGLPV